MKKPLIFLPLVFAIAASGQNNRTTPQSVNPIVVLNAVNTATASNPVFNIGQSVNFFTYKVSGGASPGAGLLEIQLEGSADCVTYFRISDIATNTSGGTMFSSIWWPCIRVNLTKFTPNPGSLLTATYVGTNSTSPGPFGPYNNSGALHRTLANSAAGNVPAIYTFDVPVSVSAVVVFSYNSLACAGSTLSISTGTPTLTTTLSTPALANVTTNQVFVIPNYLGLLGIVTYTPGGGCGAGNTYIIDIFFSAAELIAPASPGPAPVNPPAFADFLYNYATALYEPRLVPTTWKVQSAVAVAAATDTTIWTPAAGKSFRVMGFHLTSSLNSPCVFKDNTAGTSFYQFSLAGIPGVPEPITVNGYLSTAANNVLVINCTNALSLSGTVWGVEQ